MPEAHEKQLELYLTSDGKVPFTEWLGALKDTRARATIRVRLDRVRLGNMGDCKPIAEGVSELRIDFGPGYRVYCGQAGARVILLLCGGDKSTQKADMKRALKYWAEYKRSAHGKTDKKLPSHSD